MADYTAYFGGEWMPFNQVRIDPLDRGFLVGDCVFDVARTFNGKSFRMREHVDRLYRSLRYVRIDPGLSPDEMERISEEVIARNEPLRERGRRLPDLAVRDPGPGPLGPSGRPARGRRLRAADRLLRFAAPLRHGRPRHHRADAQLLPGRPRPQGQELQPDELQPGRARGLRRGPRGLADPDATAAAISPRASAITCSSSPRRDPHARRPGVLQGVSRAMVFDLGRELGIPGDRGGPPALRPLHGRRGVLHEHEPLRPAGDPRRPAARSATGKPGPVVARLLAAWSETVGVDIVAEAKDYASREQLESPRGS